MLTFFQSHVPMFVKLIFLENEDTEISVLGGVYAEQISYKINSVQ